MKKFILLSLFIASGVANAQACFGDPQPKMAEMLHAFHEVKLPYTYVPNVIDYESNDAILPKALEFTRNYPLQLQQIAAIQEWKSQDKNSPHEELDVIKSRFDIYIDEENAFIRDDFFLPLFKFSLREGKVAIVLRVLSSYSEATEKTWVAVLCPDGKVQKVSDIEPGSDRSDIYNYIYTIKSIINADMTVTYWREILKDGADIGGQPKPYDKGTINLLE
ncbi:hypothetical protein [Serratia sp. DD3]|uniref:hypothetical protein n=1 Tax=Serratia sp. DD3 TaxID=1410619 RepID=UPI0004DB0D59|nr:hypothetical protein [Serratia sp. DD3]KEY59882.1 hypothetical protein SRDD_09920 [Serratia sp. DD3]